MTTGRTETVRGKSELLSCRIYNTTHKHRTALFKYHSRKSGEQVIFEHHKILFIFREPVKPGSSSAYLGCHEGLLESLLPFYELKEVWPFFFDL